MIRLFAILALGCCLAGCSCESAPLIATDVQVVSPVPGAATSAGYMSLANTTQQPITITRVTSPQFASVEIHESALEDGISRMRMLAEVTILPGQEVHFRRGGKHLMLRNPSGDIDAIGLQFYAGPALVLSINISAED